MKAGRKLPVYIVSLLSNLTCKKIFNLHWPFYISVEVEPYRSNNPAQCYNCQRFGHSRLYCGYSTKLSKTCWWSLHQRLPKTKEEDPKCIKCILLSDYSHTSNYKQYPEFIKTKISRQPSNISKSSQPEFHHYLTKLQRSYANLSQTQISYSA